MITYKDILYSTTKILSDNFDCDVIVKNQEGTFENECFYVTLVPVTVKASTLKTNEKQLMISVKYFSNDKLNNYDIADKLEGLFARNIKVRDRFLNVSSVEPNFLVDEVGDMLDFLIYITYFDFIKLNNETCDNMQDVNLNMKG
nr:MAG TPA: tail completion protein [Caudoviricetes sp.]